MRPGCLPMVLLLFAGLSVCGWMASADEPPKGVPVKTENTKNMVLFDGESLKGWKSTNFGGEGDVTVEDGKIVMDFGSDMTGITWQKEDALPKSNYEVSFEANRVEGGDFFCGLTFPIKKDYLSLILGGWGGGVCGLSSLDGLDASENTTTSYREFKQGQWYKVRLRVTDDRITAWLDGKEIIDQDLRGKKLSIRGEVELSKPFGFSTWRTRGALKNIKLTRLDAAPAPAVKK